MFTVGHFHGSVIRRGNGVGFMGSNTHYVRGDMPGGERARLMRAVCGEVAPRSDWSPQPTCPECRAWLEEYDGLALDRDEGSRAGTDRRGPHEEALPRRCRVCRQEIDARTLAAGGEVCFDCATK